MRFLFCLLSVALSVSVCFSQGVNRPKPSPPRFKDFVYVDYVKSVRLTMAGVELSYPVLSLNGGNLNLSFDDMDADYKFYFFTVQYCNSDWTPNTQLSNLDVIDGFTEGQFPTGQASFNTLHPYTHYSLSLPNADMKFRLSGNYILKVYTDSDTSKLILTRRFMVSEQLMKISQRPGRTADVSKMSTHQEVDFLVDFKGVNIGNPNTELKATILQNGRWDNAYTDILPAYQQNAFTADFDYQNRIVFDGMREFRQLDIRPLYYRTERVRDITGGSKDWLVFLHDDITRKYSTYSFYKDIDGRYFIQNMDRQGDGNLMGDYANVHFNLKHDKLPDSSNVYVIGAFTDWRPQRDFKLNYNRATGAYEAWTSLKQGFYNYAYAVASCEECPFSTEEMEGSSFEAENEYVVLIYWRAFGARHDRLVAWDVTKSWR